MATTIPISIPITTARCLGAFGTSIAGRTLIGAPIGAMLTVAVTLFFAFTLAILLFGRIGSGGLVEFAFVFGHLHAACFLFDADLWLQTKNVKCVQEEQELLDVYLLRGERQPVDARRGLGLAEEIVEQTQRWIVFLLVKFAS